MTFNSCDRDRDGFVNRSEYWEGLRALVESHGVDYQPALLQSTSDRIFHHLAREEFHDGCGGHGIRLGGFESFSAGYRHIIADVSERGARGLLSQWLMSLLSQGPGGSLVAEAQTAGTHTAAVCAVSECCAQNAIDPIQLPTSSPPRAPPASDPIDGDAPPSPPDEPLLLEVQKAHASGKTLRGGHYVVDIDPYLAFRSVDVYHSLLLGLGVMWGVVLFTALTVPLVFLWAGALSEERCEEPLYEFTVVGAVLFSQVLGIFCVLAPTQMRIIGEGDTSYPWGLHPVIYFTVMLGRVITMAAFVWCVAGFVWFHNSGIFGHRRGNCKVVSQPNPNPYRTLIQIAMARSWRHFCGTRSSSSFTFGLCRLL